jgi:hypothetical protein
MTIANVEIMQVEKNLEIEFIIPQLYPETIFCQVVD